jgi:hypothetical protein
MAWEPLPLEVAEWMGMDDDHLRTGSMDWNAAMAHAYESAQVEAVSLHVSGEDIDEYRAAEFYLNRMYAKPAEFKNYGRLRT